MSEPDNLADSFGPPARSLSTMLPPRRRRTARTEDIAEAGAAPEQGVPDARSLAVAPEPPSESAPPPSPSGPGSPLPAAPAPRAGRDPEAPRSPATTPAPSTSTGRAPASRRTASGASTKLAPAADDQTSYQVVVYVHPSVKAVATSQRREQKVSNAEIAFDAIDAVQHRLDGLIKTRRLQSRPDSSLFPGRVRRGRVSGGGAAAAAGEARRILWGFRATGQELAVIDRLVERSGAESRSELVATALEEVLLPNTTSR